jgi:transposase-like protein
MESLADDVVDEILNGFSYDKPIICPICKAAIVLVSQDIEAKSNFYYCAKCGFTLSRPRK